MAKAKLIYIIGSIVIGLVGVVGVFFGLTAGGVINTTRKKIVIASASNEKIYDGTALECKEWSIVDGELKEGHTASVAFTSSITDVGEIDNLFMVVINDHVGADVTDDYLIEKQAGKLKVAPRPLTISTSSAEKTYDGTPLTKANWEISSKTPVVEGHKLKVDVTGTLTDVGVVSNSATVEIFTKEGKDVTKNYMVNYALGSLEVKPLPIVISTGAANKYYDGERLIEKSWILSEETPILSGHVLEVVTKGEITEVGITDNIADATITADGVDVTKNYKITWQYGELVIYACPLKIITESAEKVYDGTALTCEEIELEGTVSKKHELKVIFKNSQTTVGSTENDVIVGVYDGEVDVSYKYEIELELGTLTVTPREITIRTGSESKVYDGTPLTCDDYLLEGTIADGQTLEITATGTRTDAGKADNTATAVIYGVDEEDVTSNYKITWELGTLTVTPREITIRTGSESKVYDGTPLTCDDYLLEGTIADGQTFEITVTGTRTEVGTAPNSATIVISDANENDVTSNYTINCQFGTLEVTPLAIIIYTGSAAKIYDGKALTENSWNLSNQTPLVGGHELTVTVRGTILEVGEVDNIASAVITENDVDVTTNYKISWQYGTLTVHPCPITVVTESANKTYDGTPLTCEKSWIEGMLIKNHELKVVYTNSQTDAGSIENFVVVSVYEEDKDVTYLYDIEKVLGTLTVYPREITIRTKSAEKEYDGTPLTCEIYDVVSVLKVLDEHTLYVTVSGEQLSIGSSPNTFGQIYITGEDDLGNEIDVTRNYKITEQLGTLKVKGTSGGNTSGGSGDDMGNGTDDGGNPSGGLADDGNGDDETVVIEILSDYTTSLYLRNFSYGDYTGQGWEGGVSYTELLDGEYCYNYLFSILLEKAQFPLHSVEIKSSTSYVLPYYMEMEHANYNVPNNDVAYRGDITSPYSLYYYSYDFVQEGTAGLFGANLGSYAQAEAAYEAFVKEHYLSVPQSTLTYLKQLIAENSFKANDTKIIEKVAKYIQNSAAYDLEYDKALDGEADIVVSFLKDYKTGVCRHYASAATLLYRALGIPARFVSGYLADAKAGEWTQVKAKQGHAWVEVYLSGYGWVQVEVTGGSFDDGAGGAGGGAGGGGVGKDPKELTFTPVTVAVQYDGTNEAIAKNQVRLQEALPAGYTYEATVEGEKTTLGKGKSTITSLKIFKNGVLIYEYVNGEESLNTEDWKVKVQTGVLHLYLQKLTFTSSSYSQIYNGEILKSGGEYEWTGSLEEGHVVAGITFTAGIREVGKVANTFKVLITDENGQDITDWYLVEKIVGSLTVKHREINITAGSKSVEYTVGMEKVTCEEYTISSTQNPTQALPEGDSVSLQMTEESYLDQRGFAINEIDVSTIVIVDSAGKDVTGNYVIKTKSGILIVQ